MEGNSVYAENFAYRYGGLIQSLIYFGKNRIREDESVKLGCMEVRARFTPGHAVDGVTYVVDLWRGSAPPVAIVGDAIFAGSMGKDFSTPELAQLKVREQILSLPGDTLICPGHGPVTTVSQELEHNPFF